MAGIQNFVHILQNILLITDENAIEQELEGIKLLQTLKGMVYNVHSHASVKDSKRKRKLVSKGKSKASTEPL